MWQKSQVRAFVKTAKAEFGPGWDLLGPRIQEALIYERAMTIVLAQAKRTVDSNAIRWLIDAMRTEAGLLPVNPDPTE